MSKIHLLRRKAYALSLARIILFFPELIYQPDPIRHALVWTIRGIFRFFNPFVLAYPKLAFSELFASQHETCTKKD